MEIKALCYKNDGQTTKMATFEVEQIAPNIFTGVKDRMGNCDLFFNIEGQNICFARSSKSSIMRQLEQCIEVQQTFFKYVENPTTFAQRIYIDFYSKLGRDTTILENNRAEWFERKEQEEKTKELQRIQNIKHREAEDLKLLQQRMDDFLIQEQIPLESFLKLLAHFRVDVHPRTKGMINKFGAETKIGQKSIYLSTSKKYNPNLQSIFDLCEQLAEKQF